MATKAICSIAGCGKSHKARGYCGMHFRRLRLHGDPLRVLAKEDRPPRKMKCAPANKERNLEMVRLYTEEGVRLAEVSRKYGMHVASLRKIFRGLGVAMRDERAGRVLPTRRANLDIARCIELYVVRLLPAHQIASEFGCHANSVRAALRRAGVKIRHHNDTKRGKTPKTKIDIDPGTIRNLFANGATTESEAAAALGVGINTMRRERRAAGIMLPPKTGPKNPNWRDDLTPEERASRRDMYKQANWRAAVYARDNYTCRRCGDADGGNLNAHHIQAHCENVSDRWDVSNGITLCKECHRAFHSRFGLKGFGRPELMDHLASGSCASSA